MGCISFFSTFFSERLFITSQLGGLFQTPFFPKCGSYHHPVFLPNLFQMPLGASVRGTPSRWSPFSLQFWMLDLSVLSTRDQLQDSWSSGFSLMISHFQRSLGSFIIWEFSQLPSSLRTIPKHSLQKAPQP